MRAMSIALSCCAVFIGLTTAAGVKAEVVKASPQITVFTPEERRSASGSPAVLRGSAIRRGTVDGSLRGRYAPARFDYGAGEKLWLTDPVSGEVIVCDERRSSRVGGRFIGCVRDRLPFLIEE